MAAFDEIDYTRFDVRAAVECEGVVVVDRSHRDSCLEWLEREDYEVESIDFRQGIAAAVPEINELFRWKEQFGYELSADRAPGLDALRDGFEFDLQPGERKVLELKNADVAYRENRRWCLELLYIAHEHAIEQLALGARFFMVLFLDPRSRLIGKKYESLVVPDTYVLEPHPDHPFGPAPVAPPGT
jgi:hypothetical protein